MAALATLPIYCELNGTYMILQYHILIGFSKLMYKDTGLLSPLT